MWYITVTMSATSAGISMFDHQLGSSFTVVTSVSCKTQRESLLWLHRCVYNKPIRGSKVTVLAVINTPGALQLAQNELQNTNVNFGKCSSCF